MADQANILLLRKNIERALEVGVSAEEVGDIVAALSEVGMTIELLRSTKIGVTIAAVRKKFPDAEVGGMAKDMIQKWKVLVPAKSPSTSSLASSQGNSSDGGAWTSSCAAQIITLGAPPKQPGKDLSQQADRSDCSMDDPRYAALSLSRKKVRCPVLSYNPFPQCPAKAMPGPPPPLLPRAIPFSLVSPPLPPHTHILRLSPWTFCRRSSTSLLPSSK